MDGQCLSHPPCTSKGSNHNSGLSVLKSPAEVSIYAVLSSLVSLS